MKNLIALLLALVMVVGLVACTPAATEPEPPIVDLPTVENPPIEEPQPTPQEQPDKTPELFVFTRENFPKLDGSTSTVPLAQAMAAILLSEPQEQVEELINFSRTTRSYENLIYQSVYSESSPTLLLAAEPAESIWELKAKRHVEWNMEPFAIDGLIFVVNEDNPVDSLTVEQVQKIYTGEITNWSEVGGDDVEIAPFQRNEEAGSQTMMKKLVMGELPMMEPPSEYREMYMKGLIDAVRNYEDSTGAIGYSVYYYANDMRMAEGLKILQINGVEPGADSFRDKTYPFTNPYYVVMKNDRAEDDPTTILFNWILSKEGQRLVDQLGYVAVQPPSEDAAADTVVPSVYANWAILEDTYIAAGNYPLYWQEPKTELIPHDGYGMLTPFYGKLSQTFSYDFPIFGLATLDGKVVVEPVYFDASSLCWNEEALPVFALQQMITDEEQIAATKQEYPEDWWFYRVPHEALERTYGLAAATGSWYIPPEYAYATAISPDRILLVDIEGKFWLCDLDGNIEESPVTENAETLLGENWRLFLTDVERDYEPVDDLFVDDLFTTIIYGDEGEEPQHMWVDFQTGEITYAPYIPDESDNYVDLTIREDIVDPNTGLIIRENNDGYVGVYDPAAETWVIEPLGYDYMYFMNDVITKETYICKNDDNTDLDTIYNSSGKLLFETKHEWTMPPMSPVNGVFSVHDGNWSGLMDKEGNWVMRFVIPSNND